MSLYVMEEEIMKGYKRCENEKGQKQQSKGVDKRQRLVALYGEKKRTRCNQIDKMNHDSVFSKLHMLSLKQRIFCALW